MNIKKHFLELLQPHFSSHGIAMAFSLGSFLAIIPTPGFSVLLGISILSLFPKLNKLSLALSYIIFNPITIVPLYTLSYKIGNLFFINDPVLKFKVLEKH